MWSSIGETLRDHHEGDAAAMILKFPIATVAEQSTDFRAGALDR